MNQIAFFGIFAVILLSSQAFAEFNCMAAAKSAESVLNCCKVPDSGDPKALELVLKEHPELKNTSSLSECLIAKHYMAKLNLTKLKSEDIKNYIRIIFKEAIWIEAMDNVTDQCLELQPNYVKAFQKHYKITDGECDMKYETFMVCMMVFSYKECPSKDLINIGKCKSTKTFLENCVNDGEALISYIEINNI